MIDRVTITGADNSIDPRELISLSKEFPFVEWGILVSKYRTIEKGGCKRYPSMGWISDLLRNRDDVPNLAVHICGKWTRDILAGIITVPQDMVTHFGRVQLNFRSGTCNCNPAGFARCLARLRRPIIFQLGRDGNDEMSAALAEDDSLCCFGLFDSSGGAGVVPDEWPTPVFISVFPGEHGIGVEQWAYHGYAGGLGPDNLAEQIHRILQASSGTSETHEGRIWIDMESRVRSQDDVHFDLNKVRQCLEVASPFVGKLS